MAKNVDGQPRDHGSEGTIAVSVSFRLAEASTSEWILDRRSTFSYDSGGQRLRTQAEVRKRLPRRQNY